MKIRPLDDRVVIDPLEAATVTPGGIIMPDNARGRPSKGTVVAVGPGRFIADSMDQRMPCQVKEGDTVLFTLYAGDDIDVGGKAMKIMKDSDILGVLEVAEIE